MTKKQRTLYHGTDELRDILEKALKGKKYQLDCGHLLTWHTYLGNDITIYNGKKLKIICSQCGY